MLKVLITGSTGFVGGQLVPFLAAQDCRIFTVDRRPNEHPSVHKSYVWEELEMVPKVDCVVHLAGKAHDLGNDSQEEKYFLINVGLTEKILHYFTDTGSRTIVYLSSVKAVTDDAHIPITEYQDPAPSTSYGRSKLAAEQLVNSAPLNENQNRFILRPSLIYGPNCKGNLKLLYYWVKYHLPYPLGAFENRRTYLSIDNLNYVILQICRNQLTTGTYNVADTGGISTVELINIIGQALGKKPLIWNWNRGLVSGIFSMGTWLNLPANKETFRKLTSDYLVNTDKLHTAMGSQLPVDTRNGLRDTFSSFI